jgi:hypothetical protein
VERALTGARQVGPIAASALKTGEQQYLADLQILPGRFEFGYLPVNTQAIVIQPLAPDAFLVPILLPLI